MSLLAGTIRLATPILLPALGQIYTQRAGILNLGVEGTMTIGAVAGFSAAYKTGNLWIGLLSGMFFGMLWSLIMAWLSVTMRANQVIAGIALNILGAGTAVYPFWCTESAASGNTVCSREYSGIIIPSGDRTDFLPA